MFSTLEVRCKVRSKVQNEIHITVCKVSIVLAAFNVYPIRNFPYKHGCHIHFELLNFVTNGQLALQISGR